jgi:hypothetical protein
LSTERPRREFAASALPLTIELARAVRDEIAGLLPEESKPFCFDDRVFLLLVPEMQRDVVRYYASRGEDLAAQLNRRQLESLDSKLFRQLFEILAEHSPAVALALRAASESSPAAGAGAKRRRRRPSDE